MHPVPEDPADLVVREWREDDLGRVEDRRTGSLWSAAEIEIGAVDDSDHADLDPWPGFVHA